jgi:hypothetical protein
MTGQRCPFGRANFGFVTRIVLRDAVVWGLGYMSLR